MVIDFTTQSGYNLSGSFTSTYPVETAIMTQSQFAASGNPYGTPSYVWSQFPQTAGSFTVPLQAGNYTFLFINNQSITSTITITSDVALNR